jgi:hypothetical protein
MQGRPTEPATRIPRKASPGAAQLWGMSVLQRFQLAVNPDEETAKLLFRAGIESFDERDLALYVQRNEDVIPLMREWMQLDHPMVRPLAQSIIRTWWYPYIYNVGMDPEALLQDIVRDDPRKGAVLNTPAGRRWWNATVYNLFVFLRAYAQIPGEGGIAPPPNMPEKLKRRALAGASRLLQKIQGPNK